MKTQRGAAILTAMLTVVLVATLASSMLWQQWRGVEVESAQRTRVQAAWILVGALDWARLILREDARQGGADHLAEPWAVPLAPARLSTFLAAERGQANVEDASAGEEEAFLSGAMEDLQARLNATNLIDGDKLHAPSVAAWARLFKYLNLPERELNALTQSLLRARQTSASVQPRPLVPKTSSELTWLGLSPATLQALAPFVTVLPERTPVNLNTAAPEVLLASVVGMDMAQAQHLIQQRAARPIDTTLDADQLVNNPAVIFDSAEHAVASRFFGVTGQLRMGQTVMQEQSVLQRDGLDVKTLSRRREVVPPQAARLQ
ncbi:MAG: type II secretion system minor pseudopilin GspK [Comamonadaceae bacterium]|nr:type II secretion system minor pseudopilin GspK [Comamonadaceae bacterium]